MKPILTSPDPVLTAAARTVTSFDKRLTGLVRDMKATLRATVNPKGVGLAAPQIGEPRRVFVTRPKENSPIRVFINPEIVSSSKNKTDGVPGRDNKLEGCLSIPKIWGKVKRSTTLTLAYQDESGAIHREKFSGFLATIIQHETDHVNGILFVTRVLEQRGKLYQAAEDENGKEVLEEVKI
jgi:peptide deformylase